MAQSGNLRQRSIDIIKQYQDPSGAYVASPNFSQYRYCWLRDGSFTAHAMDRVGEFESSRKFFTWVQDVLIRYQHKLDALEHKLSRGIKLQDGDFLHTRYMLNGEEGPKDDGWGNFQIDGYGTWLWALAQHIQITKDQAFLKCVLESINITCRYLSRTYQLPCFDLWEENPQHLHTYSLSAVYGGLQAVVDLTKTYPVDLDEENLEQTALQVRNLIQREGVRGDHFVKHLVTDAGDIDTNSIDASLIGICTPYQAFPRSDKIFQNTLKLIEKDLVTPAGGVYRFRNDTYYGGGEWTLLAGWLGWHYARNGKVAPAKKIQAWIEKQANDDAQLPEQVSGRLLFPMKYQQWVEDWGEIASPLLWSHAMYLILLSELDAFPGTA